MTGPRPKGRGPSRLKLICLRKRDGLPCGTGQAGPTPPCSDSVERSNSDPEPARGVPQSAIPGPQPALIRLVGTTCPQPTRPRRRNTPASAVPEPHQLLAPEVLRGSGGQRTPGSPLVNPRPALSPHQERRPATPPSGRSKTSEQEGACVGRRTSRDGAPPDAALDGRRHSGLAQDRPGPGLRRVPREPVERGFPGESSLTGGRGPLTPWEATASDCRTGRKDPAAAGRAPAPRALALARPRDPRARQSPRAAP